MENKMEQPERKRQKCNRRDWDRSEWFRRWLELIRQKPAPASVIVQ